MPIAIIGNATVLIIFSFNIMCKTFSKGMPEWQPRSLWKCPGFRISIYLLLQIVLLTYFLTIVVKSDGQQEQGKGFHKFKQIDIPSASSGVNSGQSVQVQVHATAQKNFADCGPINSCQNAVNCSEQIVKCLSVDKDRNKIVLQICYPSAFALPLSTRKMHQQQLRFGRRFQLSQKRQSVFCQESLRKEYQSIREKAVWLDFKFIDDSTDTTIDSSILFGKRKFYDIIPANYNFDDMIKTLFYWNNTRKTSSNSQSNPAKSIPSAAVFLGNIGDGAFIDDFPLVALAMDLSPSMDFWRTSGTNFSIYWKVGRTKKKELTTEQRQKRLKECQEDVNRMNQEAGVEMYKVNVDLCLMTKKERLDLLGGIPNPNPEGLNQTFGGQAKKPLVPASPEDPEKQRARMTHVGKVPAKYAFNPKRGKRQVGAIGYCDVWIRDARQMWPGCEKIISHIRDQQAKDCWAVAVASVLTDRACIAALKAKNASGKLSHFKLGPEYLKRVVSSRDTSECTYGKSNGREGGHSQPAWEYYTKKGAVNELCKPYIDNNPKSGWESNCFHSCDSNVDDNGSLDLLHWRDKTKSGKPSSSDSRNYVAEETAEQWIITKGYAGTLYKVTEHRTLHRLENPGWDQTIINEFEENGPVCATIDIYKDFYNIAGNEIYRYDRKANRSGGHVVRIIGYGEHDCTAAGLGIDKFWLIANSWGIDSMNKGTLKMARGENECGIEGDVTFGQVKWVFGN